MAGDEGTPVSLKVRPSDGGQPERVTLVRRSIAEPVVASRTIHAGAAASSTCACSASRPRPPSRCGGWRSRRCSVTLTASSSTCAAIPGGLLSQAVAVSRVFVDHGVVVSDR